MAGEIAYDLQEFERFDAGYTEVEVLGARIVERGRRRQAPLDPIRSRAYHALVWVRAAGAGGAPIWAVVEASRAEEEDGFWQRVIVNRELVTPLAHPRRGEDADGTWHGFARYSAPPTSADVCDFARVSFLISPREPDTHVVVEELRRAAWRRVTGAEPVCGMNEGGADGR